MSVASLPFFTLARAARAFWASKLRRQKGSVVDAAVFSYYGLMPQESEPTNWRAVAAEYRKRLHTVCFVVALAAYAGMNYLTALTLDWLDVEPVWVETIAMFVWLPLGFVAWHLKSKLEDWAGKGLPRI